MIFYVPQYTSKVTSTENGKQLNKAVPFEAISYSTLKDIELHGDDFSSKIGGQASIKYFENMMTNSRSEVNIYFSLDFGHKVRSHDVIRLKR